MISENELCDILRSEVKKAGSQSKWARRHSIHPQYVNAFLNGTIGAGRQIYEALGYKRIISFIACNPNSGSAKG
jgi:hypothetical protein